MKYLFPLLTITVLFVAGCSTGSEIDYPREKIDALAQCLADKGVKEYGAFWCPNCAKQAKLFGTSEKILKQQGVYIECDPRCIPDEQGNLKSACKGIKGQPELCLEKNVEKYPTWEFSETDVIVGVKPLAVLDQKSGCGVL